MISFKHNAKNKIHTALQMCKVDDDQYCKRAEVEHVFAEIEYHNESMVQCPITDSHASWHLITKPAVSVASAEILTSFLPVKLI